MGIRSRLTRLEHEAKNILQGPDLPWLFLHTDDGVRFHKTFHAEPGGESWAKSDLPALRASFRVVVADHRRPRWQAAMPAIEQALAEEAAELQPEQPQDIGTA